MTDLRADAAEETEPPVPLVRRSLVAFLRAFAHWPDKHDDFIANRLIETGWDVVTRLHNGQRLRIIEPDEKGGEKIMAYTIPDDPYACPDLYVSEVRNQGGLEVAIAKILGQPQPVTQPTGRLQALYCILEFEPHVHTILTTYMTGSSLNRPDAVNRLIQLGAYRVLAPKDKVRFEYFDETISAWKSLPQMA